MNYYIRDTILTKAVRFQDYRESPITIIAGAINILFNTQITADDVLAETGWSRSFVTEGRVGNQTLIKGLQTVSKNLELTAEADVFLNRVKKREQSWEKLEEELRNKNSVLIYHWKYCYSLLAGYDTSRSGNAIVIPEKSLWFGEPMR